MDIDLYQKAQELLEMLANSIYDRDPKLSTEFSFTLRDKELTKEWLEKFVISINSARL